MTSKFKAVVFDMGGVLVELGPVSDLLGEADLGADEFWRRWLASPTVREFEMGRCTVTDFGDRLVEEMELSLNGEEFIDRFRQWPRGLYPGVLDMINSLPDDVTIGILSNTNELHWTEQKDAAVVQKIAGRLYLSYELGMAKPGPDIFDHALADLDIPGSQILFVDDNQINVDSATDVGLTGILAKGPDQLRMKLTHCGLI